MVIICNMSYFHLHLQMDGKTVVTYWIIESYHRCLVNGCVKQWMKWLTWAEFLFNSSHNDQV